MHAEPTWTRLGLAWGIWAFGALLVAAAGCAPPPSADLHTLARKIDLEDECSEGPNGEVESIEWEHDLPDESPTGEYDWVVTTESFRGITADEAELRGLDERVDFEVDPDRCPLRATLRVSDYDQEKYGTSQTSSVCLDAQCKAIDCDDWSSERATPIAVDTPADGAQAARTVKCQKVTYREIHGVPELTWVLRSAFSYALSSEPTVLAHRYGAPAGPTVAKGSDFDAEFHPDIANPKEIASDTSVALRLPLRMTLDDLVPAPPATNPSYLQAGWTFNAYTVGCAVKQSTLHAAIKQALGGTPIGTRTLHLVFNETDFAVPVGENGWCYYLADEGSNPTFDPNRSTDTGKECVKAF